MFSIKSNPHDGTPDTCTVIAVAVGDERELGETTVILVGLGEVTTVVLSEIVPSAVRLANIGQSIGVRIPYCTCIGERIVHGTVHVPEETLCILSLDKDGVYGHVDTRLLVEEAISDVDIIDTGAQRPHPHHDTCYIYNNSSSSYFEFLYKIHCLEC